MNLTDTMLRTILLKSLFFGVMVSLLAATPYSQTAGTTGLRLHGDEQEFHFQYLPSDPNFEVFVLGDAPEQASDSRQWGPVPERSLRGRPRRIVWAPSRGAGLLDWRRLGAAVR